MRLLIKALGHKSLRLPENLKLKAKIKNLELEEVDPKIELSIKDK